MIGNPKISSAPVNPLPAIDTPIATPEVPTPRVGDIVHYWPAEHKDVAQPFAAIVCFVHTDRLVNLAVFMSNGVAVERMNVALLQDGDERPATGTNSFAEWPQDDDGEDDDV